MHFAKISLLSSSCVTERGFMQAKYRGQLVEVWKISHQPIREIWVRHAFEQARLSWNEWNKNVLNFESISGDLALVWRFFNSKRWKKVLCCQQGQRLSRFSIYRRETNFEIEN